MQIFGPFPDLSEVEILKIGPINLHLKRTSVDSDAY